MASPQLENGYTSLANEIWEHLALPGITASEYRILNVVIRKTYGFHKKKDKISLSQFQKATTMNRAQTVRTLKSLVSKRILLKDGNTYKFNKNWEEWVVSKRIPSIQTDTSASIQTDTKSSIQTDTHKRKKETITKETYSAFGADVIKAFEEIDPKNKQYYNNKTQRAACDFLLEEYGLEDVLKRISVLPKTNKVNYFPTITSPYELKEKWVKLEDAVVRKRSEETSKGKEIIR